MVIDTHIHPALFAPICEDQERFRRRFDAMNYHLMKPSDMALLRKQYVADVKKNLAAQLNNIDMVNPDGSVENLGDKYGKKTGLS